MGLFWDRGENKVGGSLVLLLLELLEKPDQVSLQAHMVEVKPARDILQLVWGKEMTVGVH